MGVKQDVKSTDVQELYLVITFVLGCILPFLAFNTLFFYFLRLNTGFQFCNL